MKPEKKRKIVYVGEQKSWDSGDWEYANTSKQRCRIDDVIEWLTDAKNKGAVFVGWAHQKIGTEILLNGKPMVGRLRCIKQFKRESCGI